MNEVVIAKNWTVNERDYMRVPPYIVAGICACGKNRVRIRAYGRRSELLSAKLQCAECRKASR